MIREYVYTCTYTWPCQMVVKGPTSDFHHRSARKLSLYSVYCTHVAMHVARNLHLYSVYCWHLLHVTMLHGWKGINIKNATKLCLYTVQCFLLKCSHLLHMTMLNACSGCAVNCTNPNNLTIIKYEWETLIKLPEGKHHNFVFFNILVIRPD